MSLPVFSIIYPTSDNRQPAHFRIGFPCPEGEWQVTDNVTLISQHAVLHTVRCTPTLLWNDGSVKWFLAEGTVLPHEPKPAAIDVCLKRITPSSQVLDSPVHSSLQQLTINCDNGTQIVFDKKRLLNVKIDALQYRLADSSQVPVPEGKLTAFSYEAITHNGKITQVIVRQQGSLIVSGKVAKVGVILHCNTANGDCDLSVSVSNPSAARHVNGQWDLGDPNSLIIDELTLLVSGTVETVEDRLSGLKLTPYPSTSMHLHQASSGHANWQSRVHADATMSVTLPFCGFRMYIDDQQIAQGKQTQPICKLSASRPQFVEVSQFWEHFPASVSMQQGETAFSLLGSRFSPPTELQPGEQKTRRLTISSAPVAHAQVSINPDYVQATKALPFFAVHEPDAALQHLIQQGVQGNHSFFNKRLQLDEFGWRHFGEFYADHEKAQTPEQTYFVSHYNNQYDPVNGCLYQWLLTGDMRWFRLADDLAHHVADIDIYHTDKDKPEYAGGLFWHTDHYVEAFTATHRTYSCRQPSDVYDDHAGGGGPGGQHCYTNGLLLHYLLTGCDASRLGLLSLCSWIETYYEGDNTVLGGVLAIKNSGAADLKNVKTGHYPLDRGTGNYLQALMDRYALLNQQRDINQCAWIIQHTVHPEEELTQRGLDNVEKSWFYTVFLQAVCRFIHTKEQLKQNDADYVYAVELLCHFAKWMSEHEYAYLDQPEKLEFPNQTWTTQDLRKVCVLRFAEQYLPRDKALQARQKSQALVTAIEQRLMGSAESTTTRVLCLMMQNAHYEAYGKAASPMPISPDTKPAVPANAGLLKYVATLLRQFSLNRERTQAVKRFPALQRWLGHP